METTRSGSGPLFRKGQILGIKEAQDFRVSVRLYIDLQYVKNKPSLDLGLEDGRNSTGVSQVLGLQDGQDSLNQRNFLGLQDG